MLGKLFIFLPAACLSCTVLAADVKICAIEWPPFVIVEEAKVVGGLTVDILRAAFDRVGHRLLVELRPYARCLREVKAGIFDGMSDVVPRPGYLASNMPVSIWVNSIWVRQDSELKAFVGLDAFKGKTVGLVRGYSYTPLVQAYEGWNREWVQTDAMNIAKLARGRVDFIVSDIVSTQFYLKKVGYRIRPLEPPIQSQMEYVIFNEKRIDLLKDFDNGFAKILKDGTVDRLYWKSLNMKFSTLIKPAQR